MVEKVAKGMVFGVFDGLHEGHKHFIKNAASRCETLIVVVAQDESVRRLKGRAPKRPLRERIDALHAFDRMVLIAPGDENEGEWKVLRDEKPGMVFLGYDQKALAPYVKVFGIPTMTLEAFQPDIYKSGKLNTYTG